MEVKERKIVLPNNFDEWIETLSRKLVKILYDYVI